MADYRFCPQCAAPLGWNLFDKWPKPDFPIPPSVGREKMAGASNRS